MLEVCVYGNPTLDWIVAGSESTTAYGGGVYYSTLPFQGSSLYKVSVYTVYSPRIHGHPVYRLPGVLQYSSAATVFKLVYNGASRTLYLKEKAPPLYPWNLSSSLCHIAIVNPVFHEVNESHLTAISSRTLLLAGDIQGFIRVSESNGKITYASCSSSLIRLLRFFHLIHMDLDELKAFTCTSSIDEAVDKLKDTVGGTIVVVTGRLKPIRVVYNKASYSISVDDSPLVNDKTGAGDFFIGATAKYFWSTWDPVRAVEKAHEETTRWLLEKNASSPPATLK
ncbi:MAG: sugar kinase [Desulfurococcus sp.]|nr:sugar kinase [Desulfurococcus sp.]